MPKALSLKRMDSTTTQNMDATISEHLEHVAHAIHLCNCSGGTGPHLTDPPLGSGPQSIPKPYKFKTTDPQGKPTTSAICRCCKEFLKRASDYARHYDHMHRCTGIWYLCPFCDMHVDRELRNLMVHILNHIRAFKMVCNEPLSPGYHCGITFKTPEDRDKHRQNVHHVVLHPNLYTTKPKRQWERKLAGTNDKAQIEACWAQFESGIPEYVAKSMERKIRPLGSVYDFSPNGWPYLVVDLKFKDLLNPLVYADMVKIQTGLRHTFCLQELDAIKAISSSSSPPHNHLSPLWYSTPMPPLTTTSVSPETSSASLSYSTSIYPDRPCSPGVHTPSESVLRNPLLSSSACRQPSPPRIPTDRDLIEEHREYPDCDIPRHDVYSMGFHTHFGSPVPSSYYLSTPARFSSSSEHGYLATSYSSSSSSHSPSPSPASSSSRYPTQPECQYGVSYIRQDPRPTQPEYKGCTREELSRS